MAKQVLFDSEGEKKLREGMETLADCVRLTLGPTGKSVIYQKDFEDSPVASSNSYAITDEVELEDPFENMGASLLNEVAKNVDDEAGDGVATSVLLGEAIYREGLKFLAADANPMHLREGLLEASRAVVDHIRSQAIDVDENDRELINKVATNATGGNEAFGELVTDAVKKVGSEGIVSVEEGTGVETHLQFVDGLNFDKGYLSPHFCTDREKMIAELEDPYILICEEKISNVRSLLRLLEEVAQRGNPLLVIAEDVEGEALTALVLNRLRGTLKSCAVKAPAFGDRRSRMLEDIAILTGGTVVSEERGVELDNLSLGDLGQAERVRVSEEETVITGGKGSEEDVEARENQLENQIEQSSSDYDREKLEKRLARLRGGVAVVQVGGTSESEIEENTEKIEDAVNSAQNCLEEGVIPGGGTVFIRARQAIRDLDLSGDQKRGARILYKALEEPLRQIADNVGESGSVAVEEVEETEGTTGFNALEGEIQDLREAGVLDSAAIPVSAVENASSLVGTLLTSSSFLTDLDREDDAVEGSIH